MRFYRSVRGAEGHHNGAPDPVAKPFVGAGEGSDELHDGAPAVAPDGDPLGPLGTPTRDVRKAEERMAVPKERKRRCPALVACSQAVRGRRLGLNDLDDGAPC